MQRIGIGLSKIIRCFFVKAKRLNENNVIKQRNSLLKSRNNFSKSRNKNIKQSFASLFRRIPARKRFAMECFFGLEIDFFDIKSFYKGFARVMFDEKLLPLQVACLWVDVRFLLFEN